MRFDRKKILLVDDNPVNLKLARNTLMGFYDVFTVPNAEKMFLFLEKTLPDMILLDVLMPGINGYEAMRRLMGDDRTKHIPVIFLTSMADMGSEMEGLSLGAVDYIAKPFIPQLLLKRVETHMLMEAQKEELKYINANLERIVQAKTSAVLELQNAVLATVSELVECRDDITGGHVERTSRTMRKLVSEMMKQGVYLDELSSWDIELFLQSSQLHDVGKISIHDDILLKPGKLTKEEFEEMKKHALFGEEIIDRIQRNTSENVFLTHAKILAGSHHEKWDGSGYPRGTVGENIPLQGRLMAIADVYDALVSKRPYKEAFSHEMAMRIINESRGTHFDPAILDAFVSAFDSEEHSA
ncbi:MAG: response regulator [Clostridiales Family XIII bacterium]|jgi:putative two-component system response regulator|nr:response regulator [Clostridiales Family XIII bacterium]